MGLFRNKKKRAAPHTWYSEILHWKEGDTIVARNVRVKNWFSLVIAFEDSNLNLNYLYKSITRDGFIIIEEKDTGELHRVRFDTFIKHAKNISFNNRYIASEIDGSKEYMMLVEEFQTAYKDLEEKDNPKLLDQHGAVQK